MTTWNLGDTEPCPLKTLDVRDNEGRIWTRVGGDRLWRSGFGVRTWDRLEFPLHKIDTYSWTPKARSQA